MSVARVRMEGEMNFTVWGEPQGKARPRFTKQGRTYTPKNTVDYERRIGLAYRSNRGKYIENDYVAVSVIAYYSIPKSISKKDRECIEKGMMFPTKKPDVDNVLKCVMDGLNGIAYKDDKQVVYAEVQKMYADKPRIVVYIDHWKKGEDVYGILRG